MTMIGPQVSRFCRSAASYCILGAEGTWQSGGCTLLALALADVLGPNATVYTVRSSRSPSEHTVVAVADQFVDADGAQSAAALLRKMRREGVPDPTLAPFSLDAALAADHVYSDTQRVALRDALRHVLNKGARPAAGSYRRAP
jgi:hypothetical protein